jgi:hypothetical protein
MQAQEPNPALPSALRVLIAVEAGVLAVAGIVPFFFPATGLEELPWESGPFNVRFVGAVYLASLAAVLYWQTTFRWAPGRVALLMVSVFTSLVLVVTLFYADRFDSENPGTWIWFVLYVLIPAGSIYVYLRFRHLPPADALPTPPAWRTYLLVTAAILGIYGAGLLIAPETFVGFWPWEVDVFHARLYSAIIVTLGVAAWAISRVAARTELFLVGLVQTVVGTFAILGLALADSSEGTVDWAAFGTWAWVGAFAIILVSGLALVVRSRTAGEEAPA